MEIAARPELRLDQYWVWPIMAMKHINPDKRITGVTRHNPGFFPVGFWVQLVFRLDMESLERENERGLSDKKCRMN